MKKRLVLLSFRSLTSALLLLALVIQTGATPAPPPHDHCFTNLQNGVSYCNQAYPNSATNTAQCVALAGCIYSADADFCNCDCDIVNNPPLHQRCLMLADKRAALRVNACYGL